MTFISLTALQSRRNQGLSPQGGPAPMEPVLQALKIPDEARLAKLDDLLALQWNHPGDQSLTAHIWAVVGTQHSRAEVLTAAQYVRSVQSEAAFSDHEKEAYARITEALNRA